MKKLHLLAGCLLLSACAGTTTRDGLVYRDGSWYSPASDGRGDYYTGARRDDAWDHPYDFSIGLVPLGGYCPVRYRYCTSFWADPYYDPYWVYSWFYYRPTPWPHQHPHRTQAEADRREPVPEVVEVSRRNSSERPRPRPWEERPAGRRVSERISEPRPRRRAPATGGGAD